MIQRKQTLWLLIASIAAFLTLKFPFYTGTQIINNAKTFVELNAMYNTWIVIVTVMYATVALFTIFLYNNRKKQMFFCIDTIVGSIIVLIFYTLRIKDFNDGAISITALLSLVPLLFSILALIGIYKDEKLIKSADRLR